MIGEIVNYQQYLQEHTTQEESEYLLGNPHKGIHIQFFFSPLDINKTTSLKQSLQKIQYYLYFEEKSDTFPAQLLKWEKDSEYITNNKAVASKNIFTNNPFVLSFKLFKDKSDKSKNFSFHDLTKKIKEKKDEISTYYNKLKKDYNPSQKIPEPLYDLIFHFIYNQLTQISFWKQYIQISELEKQLYQHKNNKERKLMLDEKSRITFIFYFPKIQKDQTYLQFEDLFITSTENYYKKKIFTTDKYNFELNHLIYGLSNFLNGDNIKKPFLQHKTTPFIINNRISYKEGMALFRFQKYLKEKVLPSPLPIFIDKEELNQEVVKIFKENQTIQFRDLIKKLYENHKEDLGNYYLIYYTRTQSGLEIKDIDYVSNFQYQLKDYKIETFRQIFSWKQEHQPREIPDIFVLEFEILQLFFRNKTDFDINIYFDYKIKDPALQVAFQKYKPLLYNYIYKSKREWMTAQLWKEICESSILYHIRKDEKHRNTEIIRNNLRIYFSLNHHFDVKNQNFGGNNMPSTLPDLYERIQKIVSSDQNHFQSDEEFAFGTGQLIYYLLSQSETADKTHQLIEPFLNKQRIQELKKALERTFEQYKHKIGFHYHKYNRLAGEVFSYQTEKNLKELKSFLLAGYFAKNILYEKDE